MPGAVGLGFARHPVPHIEPTQARIMAFLNFASNLVHRLNDFSIDTELRKAHPYASAAQRTEWEAKRQQSLATEPSYPDVYSQLDGIEDDGIVM